MTESEYQHLAEPAKKIRPKAKQDIGKTTWHFLNYEFITKPDKKLYTNDVVRDQVEVKIITA